MLKEIWKCHWKMSDIGFMLRTLYVVFKRLLFVNIECWNVKCHPILLIILLLYSILFSFAVQVTYTCVYEGQNNISWPVVATQVPEWDACPFPLNIPWTHTGFWMNTYAMILYHNQPILCAAHVHLIRQLTNCSGIIKHMFGIIVCILWLIAGTFDQLSLVSVL